MKKIYTTLLLILAGLQSLFAQYNNPIPITATKQHLGKYGKVKLTVQLGYDSSGTRHSGIVKPLIVAEGFDVGTLMMPEEKNGDNTYKKFQQSVYDSNSSALQGLIWDGDTRRDYDIIYVDWDNGVDYMQRNAYAPDDTDMRCLVLK